MTFFSVAGCVRVVHYTADSTGFHPRVTYEGSCQPGGLISGHQEEEQQPTTEKALFTPGESDASTIDAHPTTHHTPAEPAIDHKAPMKTLDSEPQIAPEVTQHVGQEAVATSDEKLDSLAAHQTANLNHSTEDSSLDSIDGAQRETTGRVRSDSQISAPYFANVAESHDATFDRAREIANLKTHDEGTSSVYLQQQRVPEIRPGSNAPTRSGPGGDAVYRLNEQQHFITGSPTRNPYVSYGYPRSNYAYPSAHSAPPSIYRQYNHRQAHNQRPYYPYSHAYGVRAVPVAGNRRQPHGMRRLVPTTQPTTAFYSVKPMPYQLPARKLWPLRQPIRLF